ncbi:hypothetical protein K503DRAFT_859946 [Rhizopogon vinicolor AM-OR11-026]|uniref:DUF6534 domain-containing protein n=1 Tax=Rhizopogon vinicolor AM-OR11-026 TaxID=1314800 RepID=A0A1B7MKM5_9AGAM|nr:hypothetical protein K503DRAFT_859946 [Rhizopogon vinicolor AM-OR11-026]
MSSSTQDLLPQSLDLGDTFGALLIGVTLAAVLFGVTNVQAFVYFQTHRDTGMTLYKLIVIWLRILDTLHLVLITHCVYYYLVTNYASISALTGVSKLSSYMEYFCKFHVKCSTYNISKGRSRAFPATVCIIVILGSGVIIATIWGVYQCHVFTDLIKMQWATYMFGGTIAFSDFIIASSLCYFIATSRGYPSSDSFLTKFMVYTINTGCLTSVCSVVIVITCAVMPGNLIFAGIDFFIATLTFQVYVNSYLALLNAPYYIQPNDTEAVEISEFRAHRPSLHSRELEAERL